MGNELNSTRLRFGPIAVAAAVLGLALGLAMPISPVTAGVQSDATAAKQALPSEAAETDGVMVVAGKDKNNKNWHNNKNWNNKNWNNKKVVVVRPWNRRPYYGTVIGGVALGTILGAAAYSAAAPAPSTFGTGPILQ
jgi:hypothetical protein